MNNLWHDDDFPEQFPHGGNTPVAPIPPRDNMDLSIGGVKYDQGKQRWDLLPFLALSEVVKVYTYGANKYADNNWRAGMRWGRCIGALFRHTTAWIMGERLDKESGLHHLAHATFCLLSLIEYDILELGEDDRWYRNG